jgi:hypothetical protein
VNPERSKDRAQRTLLAGICAVTFVVYLDTSITPVAIPTITRSRAALMAMRPVIVNVDRTN